MINQDLRNYINNNKDLIRNSSWELLLKGSGIHTLELIQMLYTANVNGLKETLLNTKNPYVFKSLFGSFLDMSGEITTGYFGSDPTNYSAKGFHLFSQCADLYVTFDPNMRTWAIEGEWDDNVEGGSYEARGQGWDNLIYNIDEWQYSISWFGGWDWDLEKCYIGDAEKFPLQSIDLVHHYNAPQDDDN